MFVPELYKPNSADQVRAVVSRHPLALLVTNGATVPFATHLPIVVPADADEGDLVGQRLLGHMNRANPHWAALRTGTAGKLVFNGPNTYISPVVYETVPAAPTWNFVTVHLYGTIRPIDGLENTLDVVRRTAAVLEDEFGDGWDQRESVDYFRSMVGGVGAFEFQVDSTEAMYKLSQEKDEETRLRITEKFLTGPAGSSRHQIARCMHEFGPGTP